MRGKLGSLGSLALMVMVLLVCGLIAWISHLTGYAERVEEANRPIRPDGISVREVVEYFNRRGSVSPPDVCEPMD